MTRIFDAVIHACAMINRPRLLSFDTFHLSQMASDFFSDDKVSSKRFATFEQNFLAKGYYLFLTFHHVTELINLENRSEKLKRLNFLRRLPFVAWIKGTRTYGVGTAVDLLREEISCAVDNRPASLSNVRKIVRANSICYGDGQDALSEIWACWEDLAEHITESADSARKIVGISHSKFTDISRTKLSDWTDGKIRSPAQSFAILKHLEIALQADINSSGDKRIHNKESVSIDFFDTVRSEYASFVSSEGDPVIQYLRRIGLTNKDLKDPDITFEDIGDLVVFRRKVGVAAGDLATAKRLKSLAISPSSIPSEIVNRALQRYGQIQREWKGSELNDRYMAGFAPYLDICCVDKRTHQDYNSATKKESDLNSMCLDIRKMSKYFLIDL